jgi:hypothetical protein
MDFKSIASANSATAPSGGVASRFHVPFIHIWWLLILKNPLDILVKKGFQWGEKEGVQRLEYSLGKEDSRLILISDFYTIIQRDAFKHGSSI